MHKPRQYGLLGQTLGHSHSPAIHGLLGDYPYTLFEVEPKRLEAFLRQPGLGGLNVTIPYKQTVIPFCDALSPEAVRIGSVNTLVYDENGRITGHNTDYAGFAQMLREAGISLAGRKVVILGSGGTSHTARQVATDDGAEQVVIISRSGPDNYENISRHYDADVLINTTPVGMFPHGNDAPLSLDGFGRLSAVVDVIYNPLRTRLVLQARARGIRATGGLPMLVYQAAAAAAFFGASNAPQKAPQALAEMRRRLENIVLVGMPGCGKTSIGRALAQIADRPFLDTDEMILRRAGKPVAQIFAEDGETAFRAMEREAVREATAQAGYVIATGGGTVLDADNRLSLAQTGHVFFIDRALHLLATDGRPLSVDVEALARARLPIYQALANVTLRNDNTIPVAAQKIWEAFLHENPCD